MLNCGQLFAFMEYFGIKHTGYFICYVNPFMFKLSNFPESPGIIGFLLMIFAVTSAVLVKHLYICITLSRDKSLTSDHEIRFEPI